MTSDADKAKARSIAFCSSRTLPGSHSRDARERVGVMRFGATR